MTDKNDFNWSLDIIRVYHLLTETKSISETAGRLGISQSAVTQKLSKLERMLGRKLWQRRGRHPGRSYPGGDRFEKYVAEVIKLTDHFLEAFGLVTPSQTISIVASTIPGEYLLPPVLAQFQAIYPGVKVQTKVMDSSEVMERLTKNQAEIGFCGCAPEVKGFASIRFAADEIVLIANEKSELSGKKKSVSIHDLSDQTIIWREEGSGTRKAVETCMTQKKLSFPRTVSVLEVGSAQAITEAVRKGLGVGFVSNLAIQGVNVKVLKIKELSPINRDFFIVFRKQPEIRSVQNQLIRFIETFFQNRQ